MLEPAHSFAPMGLHTQTGTHRSLIWGRKQRGMSSEVIADIDGGYGSDRRKATATRFVTVARSAPSNGRKHLPRCPPVVDKRRIRSRGADVAVQKNSKTGIVLSSATSSCQVLPIGHYLGIRHTESSAYQQKPFSHAVNSTLRGARILQNST